MKPFKFLQREKKEYKVLIGDLFGVVINTSSTMEEVKDVVVEIVQAYLHQPNNGLNRNEILETLRSRLEGEVELIEINNDEGTR